EAFKNGLDMLNEDMCAELSELRMRSGLPYAMMLAGKPVFCTESSLVSVPTERCLAPNVRDIARTLSRCSEYSLHKKESALSHGYITMRGGHRVGVCAPYLENGMVDASCVSSLNIRIAGEVIGCADEIVRVTQGVRLSSVLLAGPPLCGKTTLLRDIARTLAGWPRLCRVCIADERHEIAALYEGTSPMHLGCCVDVIDGGDKRRAFDIAIRTLSPEIIVFDELGETVDFDTAVNSSARGVCLIASVHCEYGAKGHGLVDKLLKTAAFDYVVYLRAGELGQIEIIEKAGN
ncbi:MAG: AAA family ATPase, partial [Oscillospiraceae bacterium]